MRYKRGPAPDTTLVKSESSSSVNVVRCLRLRENVGPEFRSLHSFRELCVDKCSHLKQLIVIVVKRRPVCFVDELRNTWNIV